MNLLIAIISKSFEKINERAELAAYQEKARIIYENSFLIPDYVKQKNNKPFTFLHIFTDANALE